MVAVVVGRRLVGVNNQKTTQMAAPAGSGAVEAYKKTKSPGGKPSVSAADFYPKASPAVEAKASSLTAAAKGNLASAYSSHDPFRATGFAAPPKELPKGGKKSRRKTRRRGGALTKPLPALLEDLNRDPSKATLENVVDDFQNSNIRELEVTGRALSRALRAPRPDVPLDHLVEQAKRAIRNVLAHAGGRRRKTTRRR